MRYQTLVAYAPYFYSILVFFGLWFSDKYVDYIWYIFAGLVSLFFLTWISIVRKKFIKKEQWIIAASPFVFLLGSLSFIVLVDSVLLKQVVIFLIAGGLFFVFRAMYFFHWHSAKYQPSSLQIQVRYLNIISLFFVTTFFYALEVFLNFSALYNALIIFALLLASELQYVYIRRLKSKERLYAGIVAFLLTQVFLAIGVLPFLVYVKGMIFLIVFYVVTELYYASIRGLWKKKDLFTLFTISIVLVALLLVTTKWY